MPGNVHRQRRLQVIWQFWKNSKHNKSAKISKGSGEPNKEKVGVIKESDLEKIAEIKMSDLNANTIEQAKEMIRGTAKSMGIEIKG